MSKYDVNIPELRMAIADIMRYLRSTTWCCIGIGPAEAPEDYVYVSDGTIFYRWLEEFIKTGQIFDVEDAIRDEIEWRESFE